MTVSDLKLKIFRQIDSLEKNRLEEFYGLLLNYINGKKDISDWEKLTPAQKQGSNGCYRSIGFRQGNFPQRCYR